MTVGFPDHLGKHAVATRSHLTVANLVVGYLALLYLLPARLVVPGLGAAGRPAVLLGLGLLVWWLATRLHPGLTARGRQPIRVLLLILTLAVLTAYVLGLSRGLAPLEHRSADRYLIVFASWLGVALVIADGLRDRRDIARVVGALVIFASTSALIGALQFNNFDITPYIRVPGLTYNDVLVGLGQRGGPEFNRVYGTQQHYIEFGVALAMVLPLAIHRMLTTPVRRAVPRGALAALIIGSAIPLSISRAGSLGLVTGLIFLSAVWPGSLRWKIFAAASLAVVAFQAINPGVLGTIKSSFLNFFNDPSITARIEDYAATDALIADRPWFGRGPGTYVPEIYRVLDNQFLWSLLEIGYVGTAALGALFLGAVLLGRSIRKHAEVDHDAHLGQALAATIAVALVTSFTFDSLYFPTFAGTTFVAVGLVGALYRICRQPVPDDHMCGQRKLTSEPLNLLPTGHG